MANDQMIPTKASLHAKKKRKEKRTQKTIKLSTNQAVTKMKTRNTQTKKQLGETKNRNGGQTNAP